MHRQWQIQRGIIADRRFNATLNEGCGQDYIANQNHANTILKTSVGGIILLILGCVFGQVLTQNVMATSYSITYDENVVTNMPVDVAGASYTGTAVVSNVTPARDGYDFLNWCTVFPTNNNGIDVCTGGSTYAPGGSYTLSGGSANNLKLHAMWKKTYMQDFTKAMCEARASSGNITVYDRRDDSDYTVRYINGNCWMTQNLRIGSNGNTTISSTDSNFTGNSVNIKVNDLTSGITYTEASSHFPTDSDITASGSQYTKEQLGAWYNHCAASAGTVCQGSTAQDATSDICPAGWRLPTHTENSGITSQASAFSPIYGGNYYNGQLGDASNYGYWWSSTAYNATNQYYLYYGGGSLYTNYSVSKRRGFYVRCVRKPDSLQSVATWGSSLAIGDSKEVIDERDGKSYTVAKLADGKVWMLDNLALDLTNSTVKTKLTSSTTNASDTSLGYLKNGGGTTSDKYATAGVANWKSYSCSAPLINMSNKDIVPSDALSTAGGWKIGGYYNYCAASAGSYCYGNGTSYGTSSGNATEDICPKGWRLPTGASSGEFKALYDKYSSATPSQYEAFRNAFHLPLSGYFANNQMSYQGSNGDFWSSTRDDNYYMHELRAGTSGIYPASVINRDIGLSVRCVAGS